VKLLPKANNQSFVGNAVLIFLYRIFPTLANFFVIIYFSHQLDTTTYGSYINFWVRLYFISAFAGLGIQAFLLTYAPGVVSKLIKQLKLQHYLLLALWLCISAVVFSYVHTSELNWLPFSFLFVYVLAAIIESVLMVFRNLYTLIVVNGLVAISFCWLHYQYVQQSFSLDTLFMYLLLLGAVKLLIYIFALIVDVRKHQEHTEMPDMKAVRTQWVHMGMYDMLQIVFTWVDKFIIAWILSESLSAIYNNGARDVPFLPILMGAVGSAALMQLSADKHEEAPVTVMNKSGRILSAIVFPLFFFLVFFRYELFEVVFSDKYTESVPIFLLAIMVLPLRAYNFTVVLQNKHKGGIINKGAVLDLVLACVLMYPLYVWLGLPGVAFSFVISTYLQAAYYLFHTSKLLSVNWTQLLPLKNWIIKLIVFASLFIGIHYLLVSLYTPRIVLICGLLTAFIITAISLLTEIRVTKRKYGNTATTSFHQA
jgi:O-antigen/teichoic acid export membrane protein